jgi:hypothetical protein
MMLKTIPIQVYACIAPPFCFQSSNAGIRSTSLLAQVSIYALVF